MNFYCIRYNCKIDSSSSNILTPFNYHQWKEDIEISLRYKGIFRVTIGIDIEPNAVIEKEKYWYKLDEVYGFLCLSISKDLILHLSGLNNPKELREQLSKLFGKQVDLRSFQLENEPVSLNPSNFETINEFFTKFKQLVLQLKQCEVEKKDD